jgi:hypothetical protein
MSIRQAITRLTAKKPHVVAGRNLGPLDGDYALGTMFQVKILAAASRVRVSYNGEEKGDVPGERGEVLIRVLASGTNNAPPASAR